MAATDFQFEGVYGLAPVDRAGFATRIMTLSQHARREVCELDLACLSSLKEDLETIIVAMNFAKKPDFNPDDGLANQRPRRAFVTADILGVDQAEVGKLFRPSLGRDKFKVYKSVGNLADDWFSLESLLKWKDAGCVGAAVQGAMAQQGLP